MIHEITCENVSISFTDKPTLINDLSFTLGPSDEFTVLLGSNGSGKSILLKTLRGLNEQYRMQVKGTIRVGDLDPLNAPAFALGEQVGIVFQNPSTQFFNNRVIEEIRSGPILLGCQWNETERRAERVIEQLNIGELRDRNVWEISGGQQQKVVIASILAMNPDVLLLDEPTSYLDRESTKSLIGLLDELAHSGTKVLMTTHNLSPELISKSDRFMFLDAGNLSYDGKPDDFPADRYLHNYDRSILNRQARSGHPGRVRDSSHPALEMHDVTVEYRNGTRGLIDASCEIPQNQMTCLLGANGSGKTTLVKAGLDLVPFSGDISLFDTPIENLPKGEIPRRTAYVTQDPTEMIFMESVYEEVRFAPKNLDLSNPDARVDEVLEQLGISNLQDAHPEALSVGQQRLVTIAVALATEPDLLFLDEPELALDPDALETTLSVLENGPDSIVLITHEPELFLQLCGHVILLDDGRVQFEGSPRAILNSEKVSL
jgi:energy-coupling factor transport system ATP-binding protein